jgi:hypothetical protein
MTIDLILVDRCSCDCVLVHTILFKLSFHHYIHFVQHTAIVNIIKNNNNNKASMRWPSAALSCNHQISKASHSDMFLA